MGKEKDALQYPVSYNNNNRIIYYTVRNEKRVGKCGGPGSWGIGWGSASGSSVAGESGGVAASDISFRSC